MDLIKYFEKDRFAKHSGIELIEISKGMARAKMEIREEHINAIDVVQGGAIFTLADLVFAAASNSHGTIAMAINVNISFVKAVKGGTLYAEAKEVTLNPKLGNYQVTVTNDDGDIIATFMGMAYRKKDSLF